MYTSGDVLQYYDMV